MNTSQAFNSSDCDKFYLHDQDILFLLSIVEKSGDIYPIAQSKLEEIYKDIDYACVNNIRFNQVETYKEIK